MPDISMCMAQECPKKEECYRFRAIPSQYRQSYLIPTNVGDTCQHYWPITGYGEYMLQPFTDLTTPLKD